MTGLLPSLAATPAFALRVEMPAHYPSRQRPQHDNLFSIGEPQSSAGGYVGHDVG
jgi:hypothetical protein